MANTKAVIAELRRSIKSDDPEVLSDALWMALGHIETLQDSLDLATASLELRTERRNKQWL